MGQLQIAIAVVKSRELKKNLMVTGAYFAGIVALRLVSNWASLVRWSTLALLFGGMAGALVDLIDRLIYVYVSQPGEPLSLQVQNLMREYRWGEAVEALYRHKDEQKRLATNNVLFMATWIVLAFFLITSTMSFFAKGMMLGIGLNMIMQVANYWLDKEKLKQILFWPVKREVTTDELNLVMYVFIGAFMLMTVLTAVV